MVCLRRGERAGSWGQDDCEGCPQRDSCVYDYFYNARPPEGVRVLRRQSDPPRPFVFEPPRPGSYEVGDECAFGFTLFGKGIQYLPFFLLAVRNLGESGLGKGYRTGMGRFVLESVDSLGFGSRAVIFSGDTVFNRSILISYGNIRKASREHAGEVTIRFVTPAQIKENDRFTAAPSFRGLVSRLLSRANILAEYYGSGALYDSAEALRILGQCRLVAVTRASTNEIQMERYFHRERWEKRPLAPFFTGEITYSGELSQDIMALLELGRMIHVGKMATFGNGGYEIGVRG
jgi:hypothetical protein